MSDLKPSGFANVGRLEDNRNIKALQNAGNKVTMGLGVPRQAEGKVGDITVRQVASVGLICYIKTHSGWYDINSLGRATATEWIPMILSNNWVEDSTYSQTPAYFKDSNGFVHLQGRVDQPSGTATDVITTLPSGFRPSPSEIWRFVVMLRRPEAPPDEAADSFGAIKILSSGEIQATHVDMGSNALMDLEGISFYAGQRITGSGGGSTPGGGGGSGSGSGSPG